MDWFAVSIIIPLIQKPTVEYRTGTAEMIDKKNSTRKRRRKMRRERISRSYRADGIRSKNRNASSLPAQDFFSHLGVFCDFM